MASATTEKKTSLEPSEVFCACGLLMPQLKMRELVKDQTGTLLLKWAAGDGLKLARAGIKPLDNKFVAMFNSAGDKKFVNNKDKREKLVANIVAGFSAALGVKVFMRFMGDSGGIVEKVYLTGAQWPGEVNDFRLQNEKTGFDYNSSDMVAKVDSETFYGNRSKK
jgi:hypothetical protein